MAASSEIEVLAQDLSNLAAKVLALETRLTEVEAVIERLEAAAANDSPRLGRSLGALGRRVSGDAAGGVVDGACEAPTRCWHRLHFAALLAPLPIEARNDRHSVLRSRGGVRGEGAKYATPPISSLPSGATELLRSEVTPRALPLEGRRAERPPDARPLPKKCACRQLGDLSAPEQRYVCY
jgi:hypothetical protein